MSERAFLLLLVGTVACGSTPAATVEIAAPVVAARPPRATLSFPGDLRATRQLLAWNEGNWEHAETFGVLLAEATLDGEVLVAVAPEIVRADVRRLAARHGGLPGAIRFVEADLDTFWVRDFGPLVVRQGGRHHVVDLPYGDDRHADDALPRVVAEELGLPLIGTGLDMEGGHILSDGAGTCVLTDDVIVRNALTGWTRSDVVAELRMLFGCARSLFVPALAGRRRGTSTWC